MPHMKRIVFFLLLVSSLQAESNLNEKSLLLNEKGVAAMNAKDFNSAEDYFLDALDADPYNSTAVFNLAGAYLANEENSDAVKLLEAYTIKFPADAGLQVRLGDAYFSSEKVDKALAAYNRAAVLDPKYPGLAGKQGSVYVLSNDLKNSEKYFLLAIKSEPNNFAYLSNLAAIKLALKKYSESISYAKKALQLKSSADVYITLGSAYEESRNKQSALIAYERARDLGNNSKELLEKITSLKN